ncbi:DUF4129 domain-containing protein [Streptomyces sp. CA-111067]|uniref:DUF4129 domain-containing protein n=1 Tax=Streptomyces sp. CA-111067 TaxID=3240046 RepID=UPI003D95AC03
MNGDRATAGTAGGPQGGTGSANGTRGGGRPAARRGRTLTAPMALAVLAMAGTGLAAALLRPEGSVFAKGHGAFGASNVPVLLFAAVWLFGGILAANQYRSGLGTGGNRSALELRLADLVSVALMVMAFALPIALLSLHHFNGGGSPDNGVVVHHRPLPLPSLSPGPALPNHRPAHPDDGLHLSLPRILVTIAVVLLALAAVAAAVYLFRLLHRPPPKPYGATYATLDEQDVLADAVDSGQRALRDGDDARTAVIACYAAMEGSLAASGVARHASDSPQDLLERTTASGLLTGGHAAALTALFREARYSTHPMDDTHRERAAQALSGIAEQLAAARAADQCTDDPADEKAAQSGAGAHR